MLLSAQAHYRRRQRLSALGIRAVRNAWPRGPAALTGTLMVLMRQAAQDGALSVADMLDEQGIAVAAVAAVNPVRLAETASDGRPLRSLLEQATTVRQLELMAVTQIADSGRVSAGIAIAARPNMGWTRMVNPPCCPRCAVLAGKWFSWNQGFKRHPGCDCTHIPTPEATVGDVRTDPKELFRTGRVNGASRAERNAITQGADPSRVINSRRSMYVDEAGRRLTREATTKRGGVRGPRLTPEQIYRTAGEDREKALSLLKRFGYLL